jgi:uncharacterized repeat protein (TIGR03803 family)
MVKHIILALTKDSSRKVIPALLVLLAITAAPVPVRADTFTTLQSFDGTNGALSNAPPTQVTNGDLYGTTFQGGVDVANAFGGNGYGTLFKVTTSGKLTTLYTFCDNSMHSCTNGAFPNAGLIQAHTNSNLYGTAAAGGVVTNEICDLLGGCGTVFEAL